MKSSESSFKWIEKGYELFAEEGPESIQIERLARELNLNKSGFYHYFGDRDVFFSGLMEHHFIMNGHFYDDVLKLKRFDPDYFHLLIKYKTTLLVQAQLRKQSGIHVYEEEFRKIKNRNDKAVVPLWAAYLKIPDNQKLAHELWEILRDVFYMRLNTENLTFDFIYSLVSDFVRILEGFRYYKEKSE